MKDLEEKRLIKAAKQRKKIVRLRNNHIAGSLLTLFVMIALAAGMTILLSLTYITMNMETAYNEDEKLIKRAAELFAEDDRDGVRRDYFNILDLKMRDHFILDSNGSVLLQQGDNTCNILSRIQYKDDNGEPIIGQIHCFPDTSGDYFNFADEANFDGSMEIDTRLLFRHMKSLNIKFADILDGKLSSDGSQDLVMPYWISTVINKNGDTLFFKTDITITAEQMVITFAIMVLFGILMILLLSIVMINMISSVISKNKMAKLYFTDTDTRGHNRNWFDFYGEELLCSGKNVKKDAAVVSISFVNYHSFCVCHSLAEGAEVLRVIQSEISRFFGKKSCCAHCGTSDFAVALTIESREDFVSRLPMLVTELENISKTHKFCFQIGIDFIDAPKDSHGKTVKRRLVDLEKHYINACTARATLEETDESGIAYFDDKLIEEQKWIDTVNENQKLALQNEEFLVYYQPKYDPRTNTLRGAEALIRWQSPEFGFVTPNRMIPIFEKNGFITEIDHYMITHAARDQKRWLDSGLKCVPISVNVSRAHFIESDLAEQIRDSVDSEGTPHELIEIELTESAFFDDKKAMISTIERLKSYGFTVSMDDFGSGYSSLNSLKDMPLDVLKLDAEFFRGSDSAGRGEIVVTEAIKLAQSLKMRTVAEGVEIRKQVDFLAEQGCDMIQGYYYSKPLPHDDFEQRIKSGKAEPSGEE